MITKIYTIDEIKEIAEPIAKSYGVERMLIFGSYARGEATPESDIDFRIDKGAIRGLIKLAGFNRELEEAFNKEVDTITTGSLGEEFRESIAGEEILIYEQ